MDDFLQNPKDINGTPLNEVWKRNPEFPNNVLDINKIKAIYANFETGQYKIIHPWLEKRISYHIEHRLNNGWKIDSESLGKTGHIPGTHSEVRALNELLWRLEQDGLTISDDIVTKILGYNKNYNSTNIMPRCGDCYFITKDIKMIMSN